MGSVKISRPLSSGMVKAYWEDQYTSRSESYFSDKGQAQGYWLGSLTERFGLEGGVTKEQFDRLVDGCDPNTGEQLIQWRKQGSEKPKWVTDDAAWNEKLEDPYRQAVELGSKPREPGKAISFAAMDANGIADGTRLIVEASSKAAPELREELVRQMSEYLGLPAAAEEKTKTDQTVNEHRAAYDFTIAPHKSITAAALIGDDKRLMAAHEAAVRKVMRAAEEYTQARFSSHLAITTENLIAGAFTHTTARPVGGVPDPHLHTHVVVFNMTDHEGRIRAVQPLEWYRVQRYLDAVYQAEMAVRVQELGYRLERNTEGHYAAVTGYTPKYLESISRRTREIEKRNEELGMYGAKADHIIAHQSREAKVDWTAEKVQEYHRKQAIEQGMDPDAAPRAARERGYQKVEVQGAEEAIAYAKHSLVERNAVFDRYELMEQALRYGLGSVRLHNVEEALESRQAEFVEVQHYRGEAPGARYTTPEMLRLEREVMDIAVAGKDAVSPIAPELTKEQVREAYKGHLNNQQMRLAYDVLTCPDRVFAIQGSAGVGKTTVLSPIRQIMEEQGFDVYGAAPTSGAASELREAGIENSQTLQRFLARPPSSGERRRVIVLDESSLASTVQVHRLFAALRPVDRVILVGDIRQHQSVEAGRIFEQLQQVGIETLHLNKIVRQRNSPELLEVVKEFARGEVHAGLDLLDKQNQIREYPKQQTRYVALAEDFAEAPRNSVAVSPDNDSRTELNAVIQAKLRERGVVEEKGQAVGVLRSRQDLTAKAAQHAFNYRSQDVIRFARANQGLGVRAGEYAVVEAIDRDANTLTVKARGGRCLTYNPSDVQGVKVYAREQREFAVGDRIQFTQPWRKQRIDNRDFGEITYLDDAGNVRVALDKKGHRTVAFHLQEMPHVDHGYAVTSYAIQGASKQNVLLHIAANDTRTRAMVDKVFANVAVSRAVSRCTVYCDDKEQLGPTLDRLHLKPKAHSREQVREFAKGHEHEKALTA